MNASGPLTPVEDPANSAFRTEARRACKSLADMAMRHLIQAAIGQLVKQSRTIA